jgi:toxin HigB-1
MAQPMGRGGRRGCCVVDKCRITGYIYRVKIRSFTHKPLRRLYAEDVTKGLPSEAVDKLRKMLAFLQDVQEMETLRALPAWKAHVLTGSRKGTWSLHVTRNWRLTFRVEDDEIHEVNFEDYH